MSQVLRITRRLLEEYRACYDGLEYFDLRFKLADADAELKIELTTERQLEEARNPNSSGYYSWLRYSGLAPVMRFYKEEITGNYTCSGLEYSHFELCKFNGANLSMCNFNQSDIFKSRLNKCNIYQSKFLRAEISQSEFLECLMEGTNWEGADITNTHFFQSKLSQADFSRLSLTTCSFVECDLTKASFTGADLRTVDFSGSNLDGAIFKGVLLHREAFFESTTIPDEELFKQPGVKDAIFVK
jgi:uncharacterized protein YjbI with pentapeptide repeats